jgi:hypothetical protein
MSLHALARNLASEGRGPDTELVHMARDEISGLQALAVAQGGSLTINPHTGLVEAGFFSKVGDFFTGPVGQTLGGLALTVVTRGAIKPWQAGAIIGGATAISSGSITEGLTAGLGAWAGGSIGKGLMGAATSAEMTGARAAAAEAEAGSLSRGFTQSGSAAPGQALTRTMPMTPGEAAIFGPSAGTGAVSGAGASFGTRAANAATGAFDTAVSGGKELMSGAGNLLKSGAEADKARESFWSAYSIPAITAGTTLAMGAMGGEDQAQQAGASKSMEEMMNPDIPSFDPNWTVNRVYGDPSFRAPSSTEERRYFGDPTGGNVFEGENVLAKAGGLMGLADGGPVENMSALNTVGANTGYPMANQMSPTYAQSGSRPIAEDVIRPQGDSNIDAYTGAEKFAAGGQAGEMLRNLSGMYGNAMQPY